MKGLVGLDIGGVLVAVTPENIERVIAGTYAKIEMIEGALEMVKELFRRGWRVRIISYSKGNATVEHHARTWLEYAGFLDAGLLTPGDITFVADKADKITQCLEYGVTVMIDDEQEIMDTMPDWMGVRTIHFGSPACPTHKEVIALVEACASE